ncbi:uncharacterized protein LOC116844575 [Odontomachus brunneus]|uniref:uncharacterized protein LOC116844575 n=1 Tax=Odontomachus brunneus TaxID=486640 RepID=UPI0013F18844|nr:uncharacterized protein LOC116844575 [Odontomachus brunneus]XP_032672186.1 uncharacterized protein LOC116844575 [Odontomachus brunneus]XP_032672187.1 uncharacterized protein LOC116844575 [Odontomachus brunneus]
MSQISHTSKKMRRYNRTISYSHKSSTPYKNVTLKHYNISLSGIDTGSSSSAGEVKKRPRPQRTLKKRKGTTGKKRRVVTRLADSDSEWETKSDESVKRTSVNSQKFSLKDTHEECQDDTPVCCNLFEDPCTPEKVRDAPITYEPLLESPILQSSRRLRLIPAKDNLIQSEKLLPISNLRFSKSQNVNSEETDDDTPIFHREKDIKTYPAVSKRKKSPKQRFKNFTFSVRFPTATSDLLWDEFVDKFHDDITQYLASPSTRAQATDSTRDLPDIAYPRQRIDPLSPGMECVSQYYDKVTHRWITCDDSERASGSKQENAERQNEPQTNRRGMKARRRNARKLSRKEMALRSARKRRADVYDQSDETDVEFETGGRNKKRISLREFCRKQRINKTKTPSTSSRSDTQ